MLASILTIGDELVEGKVDTNSAWIALALDQIGWRVNEVRHCRDDIEAILRNLEELSDLSRLVITTGGLGPTTDDLTTEAVTRWAKSGAVFHEATWTRMQKRFEERGFTLPPENIKQAYYPENGVPLPNPVGTALGYVAKRNDRWVACFPGVPREMKPMVQEGLLPLLIDNFERAGHRVVRKLRIFGHPESKVNSLMVGIAEGLAGVEIAYLASYAEVAFLLKVTRPSTTEAAAVADTLAEEAKRRLGDKCYGEGETSLEQVVGEILARRGETIVLAESCTGGLIAKRLTDVPGSSAYVPEAFVTYSNAAKIKRLGVEKSALKEHGAVSAEVCEQMLEGLFAQTDGDYGIAVTGIAGPGGGTDEKPVGTVFIGWGDRDGSEVREFRFRGTREDIRMLTASTALDLLRRHVAKK